MSNLDLEEELAVAVNTSTGDHDVYSHYVEQDLIVEATVMGWPLVALCGKIWVPFRDPSRYPICPICQEMLDGLEDLADSWENE